MFVTASRNNSPRVSWAYPAPPSYVAPEGCGSDTIGDPTAGRVLVEPRDAVRDDLLDLVIATASGRPTRAEINQEREIAIWKTGVTL